MALLLTDTAWFSALAALLFGGLALILWTLRTRLTAFSEQLDAVRQEVDNVAQDFAQSHAQAAPPPAPVEPPQPPVPLVLPPPVDLAPLSADVERLAREVAQISTTLSQVNEEMRAQRGERVRESIERRLRNLGFQTVAVLADLQAIGPGPTRITVAGTKAGISHKGYVVVEGGRVLEEKMTSSHEVFP